MSKKILIGLTADFLEDQKYSDAPYYALRKNYTEALTQNGACSLLLPPIGNNVDDYINLVDGIIITGGNFDIDPALYNAKTIHKETIINHDRCRFEYLLAKAAIKNNIPLLGICGGMQLINVINGGCLIQDLADHHNDYLIHEQKPYHEAAHHVIIQENTILSKITKQKQIDVNSSHHQAINKLGNDFIASAISDDGVIEAIETTNKDQFIMGVQWHPEYNITPTDTAIFKRFTQHCNKKQ
jgi:putative glutamine amidotransferase